jgi:predicted DNA-binding transcriptional regulator AlpA
MSIATIRNFDFPLRQTANQVASNFPVVESSARPPTKFGVQSVHGGLHQPDEVAVVHEQNDERLLNAREVADKLGVSERWVRDHTTRRNPKIRGIKLGMLMRYRRTDVEVFMQEMDALPTSRSLRFGV